MLQPAAERDEQEEGRGHFKENSGDFPLGGHRTDDSHGLEQRDKQNAFYRTLGQIIAVYLLRDFSRFFPSANMLSAWVQI